MTTQEEMEYRKAVIHKNAGSELLNVMVAIINDRRNLALTQLENADIESFRGWQGRAQAFRELSDFIQSCLKINQNEDKRSV
jgi:hypothetical protein